MLRSQIDARHYRRLYQDLEARAASGDDTAAEIKGVIDRAFDGVAAAFKGGTFAADPSDPAEAMVGLITCYFIESNPTFRSFFGPA